MKDRDRPVELVDVLAGEPVTGSADSLDSARAGTGLPRWSGLAAAAAVLLVGGLVLQQRGRSGAPVPPRPTVAYVAPSRSAPSAAPAPVTVIETGRRLLAVPTHWDLFGVGAGVVVRVQLRAGRVTVTGLPGAAAPATLIALPGRVVVRPVISGVGYVVPDGAAATVLGGRLGQAGPALLGPRPGQVWVRTSPAGQDATRMTLLGPDGRAIGASVVIPGDGYLCNDGTGHIVYTTRIDNESYLTSPGRWRFHTPGQLVAAGAGEVVTIERTGPRRFVTVRTDVPSGRRRVWAARGWLNDPVLGPIAPGGRTAAILTSTSDATLLDLLDLSTGTGRHTRIPLAGNAESLVWSPDGRWLFAATHDGGVVAVNAHTGAVTRLEVFLPPLTQLVLRP